MKRKENSFELKMAITVACAVLRRFGCTIHAATNSHDAWDIETPSGWMAVNSSHELVDLANSMKGSK
jgi:hypothetical protein